MKRRDFIELSSQSIGGLLIYTLAGAPMVVKAQAGTVRIALRFFSQEEAKTVVAACELDQHENRAVLAGGDLGERPVRLGMQGGERQHPFQRVQQCSVHRQRLFGVVAPRNA